MRHPSALLLIALTLAAACGGSEPAAPPAAPSEAPAAGDSAEAPAPASETTPAPDGEPAPPPLLNAAALIERAPDVYRARFRTTQGDFVVEVRRDWSPRGADRFYNLVRAGFYDATRLFRVVADFVVQFGINGDPAVSAAWSYAEIQDDPVVQSNLRGRVTFATGGPNTRTTQVFINLTDNDQLDGMGFSPFGEVVEGMEVLHRLYAGYGDGAPYGSGPDQGRMEGEGNGYLERDFPLLDHVLQARIEGQ